MIVRSRGASPRFYFPQIVHRRENAMIVVLNKPKRSPSKPTSKAPTMNQRLRKAAVRVSFRELQRRAGTLSPRNTTTSDKLVVPRAVHQDAQDRGNYASWDQLFDMCGQRQGNLLKSWIAEMVNRPETRIPAIFGRRQLYCTSFEPNYNSIMDEDFWINEIANTPEQDSQSSGGLLPFVVIVGLLAALAGVFFTTM